jgi:hypothetical protein
MNRKVNKAVCKWYMLVARLGKDVISGFLRWWVLRALRIYYNVKGGGRALVKRIAWEM